MINLDNKRVIVSSNGDIEIPPIIDQDNLKLLKTLLWKLDTRLVPFLALLYLCSFLDRINIGNARLAGLQADLNMTDAQYSWSLSIFFFGYVLFEVPSNIMLKQIGSKIWLSTLMIMWGTIMILMAFVRSPSGLLATRFFLGVSEAGLFPGVVFYLSLWYTRREQTIRIALFYSAAVFSGAFGGVL
ncbi:unnamed protein product, partial [Didymodactylos carnosus]